MTYCKFRPHEAGYRNDNLSFLSGPITNTFNIMKSKRKLIKVHHMVGNISLREHIVFISGEGGGKGIRRSERITRFSGGIEGGEASPTDY